MRDRDAALAALALFAAWRFLESRRVRIPEGGTPPAPPAPDDTPVLPPEAPTWWPSAATMAASRDRGPLPYVGRRGAPCETQLTPAASLLRERIRAQFPSVRTIGGIRCSEATNNLHAIGRALDVMTPSHATGDAIANWLVTNAAQLGVQLVIWNRIVWQGSMPRDRRLDAYTGTNPHTDHVHVETNA